MSSTSSHLSSSPPRDSVSFLRKSHLFLHVPLPPHFATILGDFPTLIIPVDGPSLIEPYTNSSGVEWRLRVRGVFQKNKSNGVLVWTEDASRKNYEKKKLKSSLAV